MPVQQTTRPQCPAWCQTDHSREPEEITGGFHHDSDAVTVDVTYPAVATKPGQLHVLISQFVPIDDEPEEVRIELEDAAHTLAVLTPENARELGELLLAAGNRADDGTVL